MKTILPETKHGTPDQIEQWLKKEKDVKLANRLNAIRLSMLKYKRRDISVICSVTRKCLLKWVKQWNAAGKEGLISKSGGSRSKITEKIRADITEVIEVKKKIGGRLVTGKLICGYLKKTTP